MDESNPPETIESAADPTVEQALPPGNHALEVAARAGFGPLSPAGRSVWHGEATPCVSCGQLVRRDTAECAQCGQDLSLAMREKMRAHAGPWYVLEHVRPFPGVTLERIIRQIRRGLIMETSIVRGPATDHQWRFAVETPGLCRYFGRCWKCHERVSPSASHCPHCLSHLSFEPSPAGPRQRSQPAATAVAKVPGSGAAESPNGVAVAPPDLIPTSSSELQELSAAVGQAELPAHDDVWDEPPRIAGLRATWVVLAALVIVIGILIGITQSGSEPVRPMDAPVPRAHQPAP